MFAAWGRFVHRFRWIVLIASILMLPVAIVLNSTYGGQFAHGQSGDSMEAQRAATLIEKQIGASPISFTAIFTSSRVPATDRSFARAVNDALAPIQHDAHVTSIDTAYDGGTINHQLISRDGHRSIAVVTLKGTFEKLVKAYPTLAKKIHSQSLQIQFAGDLPQYDDNGKIMSKDLGRAMSISMPVLILLLLFVFGALVAAGLPLGVGILAVITGSSATMILARFTDVMSAAQEIVIMIGLGVAVDYSLFILNRFREELREHDTADALATTMATAGRAILFSGVTVSIGLLGLTFFHLGAIGSVGEAGTFAVLLPRLPARYSRPEGQQAARTVRPSRPADAGPRLLARSLPPGHGPALAGARPHRRAPALLRRPGDAHAPRLERLHVLPDERALAPGPGAPRSAVPRREHKCEPRRRQLRQRLTAHARSRRRYLPALPLAGHPPRCHTGGECIHRRSHHGRG
jgi:RND superfamily putative drug exporter